jgi:hypothetical protein
MSFFNICWERKRLAGACFIRVLANVPYVFIGQSIHKLALWFFVNQFARSFTKVFHCVSFDELFNIYRFKQVSLPASLLCIIAPPPPPKMFRLSLHFRQHIYFCQYNTIVPFCLKEFFGNGTWSPYWKGGHLKSDSRTQLVNHKAEDPSETIVNLLICT